MSATPEYPRAWEAAQKVDPMMLASALDHIERTAAASRSMTRRIRWIQMRAKFALTGREYRDIDVDLPRRAPHSTERMQKTIAFKSMLIHKQREVLEKFTQAMDRAGNWPGTVYELEELCDIANEAREVLQLVSKAETQGKQKGGAA